MAQRYAEMCIFATNSQRNNQVPSYTTVGENLAITTASPGDYEAMVEGWNSEFQDYTYGTTSCREGSVCGNYTQVSVVHSHRNF